MLLEADALWSGYGAITILQGATLRVDTGEIVAVLGRNGVGKTTLMRTLSGALPFHRGTLHFAGHDLSSSASHDRARSGISYVPQGRQIFGQLSVYENIMVGAYAMKLEQNTIADRLESLLSDFPSLRTKLADLGAGLSGGQQQLLALARALITRPKLLLLDEPSEGIQPSLLDDITVVLHRVAARDGVAVLLVEQNLDFARRLASRGYLMDNGQIHREIVIGEALDTTSLSRELFGAAA